MDDLILNGVLLTPLRQIPNPKGDIYHALKASEHGYVSFGEAYFSSINQNEVKGWKKHKRMVLNIVVPVGTIKFYLIDDRSNSSTVDNKQSVILSPKNYQRLTVPSGIWMAFKGIDENNLLLNIASIEHDPEEAENMSLDTLKLFEV